MALKLGKLLVEIGADTSGLERGTEKTNRAVKGMSSGFKAFGGAMAAAISIEATRKVITLADNMSMLDARLKMSSRSTSEYAKNQQNLVNIANQTGTSYESIIGLFTKMTMASSDLGATNSQVSQLVETLSKANVVGGVSVEGAASSMLQLSQALGSGVLQGDEFRSIMENNLFLTQSIADGLGVATGQLKKMGSEGKLTSKEVFNAILSQSDTINKKFDAVPLTIGRATQMLQNNFALLVSEMNNASGMTGGIANGIAGIAKLLNDPKIKNAIQQVGAEFGRVVEIISSINGNGNGKGSLKFLIDLLGVFVRIGAGGVVLIVSSFKQLMNNVAMIKQGVMTLLNGGVLAFDGLKTGALNLVRIGLAPVQATIGRIIAGLGNVVEMGGKLSFNKDMQRIGAEMKSFNIVDSIMPKDKVEQANKDFIGQVKTFSEKQKTLWGVLAKDRLDIAKATEKQLTDIMFKKATVKKSVDTEVSFGAMERKGGGGTNTSQNADKVKEQKAYNDFLIEMGNQELAILRDFENRKKEIAQNTPLSQAQKNALNIENEKWKIEQLKALKKEELDLSFSDYEAPEIEKFKTEIDYLVEFGDEKLRVMEEYRAREQEIENNAYLTQEQTASLHAKNQQAMQDEMLRMQEAQLEAKKALQLYEIDAYLEFTKTTVDVMGRAGMEQSAIYKAFLVLEQIFAVKKLMIQAFSETNPFLQGLAFAQAGMVAGMGFSDVVFGAGRVTGGQVGSNMMTPVNENGNPEMFIQGNRKFLLTGDKGGQVVSGNSMSGGASATPKITINNYAGVQVDSSVTKDEVVVMVRRAEENAVKRVNSSLATGRGDTAKAIKSGYNVKRQVAR